MTRGRSVLAVLALVALSLGLVPVFQSNILAPGDGYFFSNWDRRSQSLVIAKIAQDVTEGPGTALGLTAAQPDPLDAYDNFDGLQFGNSPSATGYSQYASSLGVQGYLFEGIYVAGCRTVNCLTTAESTMFSLVFVLFCVLLALAVRRSVGYSVLFCGLVSPWVVSSAHNLYWVPWTWLLPACAAAAAVLARERRHRLLWIGVAGLVTGVKAATGYEYLSATTLLAASVPVLAALIGSRTDLPRALITAAQIFVACVIGFCVVLVIHLFVAGAGDAFDSGTLATASLGASVWSVLARYAFSWTSALFAIGIGSPYPSLSIGTGGFWMLTAVCTVTVVGDLARRRPGAGRLAAVLLTAAAPPLSWFVLGKSLSFAETNENYVLWYWMLVPMMVWVLLHRMGDSRVVRAFVRLPTTSATRPEPMHSPLTGRD